MKLAKLAFLATALAATPVAAFAQDVNVGAVVKDTDGNDVGTVIEVTETTITVDTGKHEAGLPAAAFGGTADEPLIAVSKERIDAMMDQRLAAAEKEAEEARAKAKAEAEAKLAAALIVGAEVVSLDAQPLGMVDQFTGESMENVVIKADETTLITLPRTYFTVTEEGILMAGANYADLMAAVNAADNGG